jgi:hypothetical protein
MQDAAIAFTGIVLGFILTVYWDKYKNHRRYKDLVRLIIIELEANKERMEDVFTKLPENIKQKFEGADNLVILNEPELSNLGWSFPKPYITEAWKIFLLSGFVVELPENTAKKLYKAYDKIHSINFLGEISVRIFQIISQQNTLDKETNENFNRFCKMGTVSQQIIAIKDVKEVIGELENIIK